ncbi:MAG: T9SS type A sorting domain-containing protein [Bacteroidia bacterium]|nr:T9SS type A sorting domain-containing protein [Bacteroidia bacterium]
MITTLTRIPFKKIIVLLFLLETFGSSLRSNPGDTTWVTVYNLRKLTQYGNYDTTATFPTGKRYRKIRLHYILGRYACPPGSQYCGSWDYTTQIFVMPSNKDTAEIARVITPYATDWLGQNKKHDYIVEVTDYASLLQGTTGMRFNYSGYSWGFTITLKLEMIEGVPPMDAVSVNKIYDGYFPFGNSTNSIENYLVPKQLNYTTPTNKVFVKNWVSGHGSDNTGCSEFCSKYYQLKLNSNMISQKQLWRSDCGVNQVYPQTGTWVYDRGNWCPGAVVWPIYHDITPITTANTNFTVDVDMEPYTIPNPSGGYNFGTQFIQYTAPNHSRDVSIEDIISPTNDANYFRNNPRCNNPVIKIKNTGTDQVTSAVFSYGIKGDAPDTYTWTGTLNYLEETEVIFPPSTSVMSRTVANTFVVNLTHVNDIASDDNTFNNLYVSKTLPVSIFPKTTIVIKFITNNFGDHKWTLYDENENMIAYRDNVTPNTTYLDTVFDMTPGCYRVFLEDASCDGLQWWANTAQGQGSMRIDGLISGTYYLFPNDFGCNINKSFIIPDLNPVGLPEVAKNPNVIDVYPNPAGSQAFIKLDLNRAQKVNYKLLDINGRVVLQKTIQKTELSIETVDLNSIANGVYMMNVILEDNSTFTRKLVIQK